MLEKKIELVKEDLEKAITEMKKELMKKLYLLDVDTISELSNNIIVLIAKYDLLCALEDDE